MYVDMLIEYGKLVARFTKALNYRNDSEIALLEARNHVETILKTM